MVGGKYGGWLRVTDDMLSDLTSLKKRFTLLARVKNDIRRKGKNPSYDIITNFAMVVVKLIFAKQEIRNLKQTIIQLQDKLDYKNEDSPSNYNP